MTPVSQILAKTREFAPWDLTDLTPVNALKVTVDHIVNVRWQFFTDLTPMNALKVTVDHIVNVRWQSFSVQYRLLKAIAPTLDFSG